MIVPTNKLLAFVCILGAPISLAAAATDAAWPVCAAACLGFALAVILDARRGRQVGAGVTVAFPELLRLTQNRDANLTLEIKGATPDGHVTIGLEFPEVFTASEILRVPLTETGLVNWTCRSEKRGRFMLENAHIEVCSPWRLWACRSTVQGKVELRVYPNLAHERKRLAALFLNRGSLGIHAQRQVGKGRDLERLREYMPGDVYEDIYWKATARRGRPITRVYQLERTQEVYVLVDTSRLSAREVVLSQKADGTTEYTTILERYITAAMILGLAAQRQGDHFGLLTFDDQVRTFVRSRNGRGHYASCRDALYTVEPRLVNPDFAELFSFLRLRLRRRALLVILTNLDDPVLAEQFMRQSEIVKGHHLLFVNTLKTRGAAPLFAKPDVTGDAEVYDRLAGHLLWQGLREVERGLARKGISMATLDSEPAAAQIVTQYINAKQRQLL